MRLFNLLEQGLLYKNAFSDPDFMEVSEKVRRSLLYKNAFSDPDFMEVSEKVRRSRKMM